MERGGNYEMKILSFETLFVFEISSFNYFKLSVKRSSHLVLIQKTADRYESSHERRNMIPKWRGKFGPQMAKSTFSAFLSLIPTHVKVFRNTELQVRLSYLVLFTYFTMMNYQAIWTCWKSLNMLIDHIAV